MVQFTKQDIQEIRKLLQKLQRVDASSATAKYIRKQLRNQGYRISDLNPYCTIYQARTTEGLDWLIQKGIISVVKSDENKNCHAEARVCTKKGEGRHTEEPHVRSFSPIADEQSEILILGTAPGATSLSTGEYYAQSNNLFWRIICHLYNGGQEFSSYEEKVICLKNNHIALWDTLACCKRAGSSDNTIEEEVYNDVEGFLHQHPRIKKVVFNGKKPSTYYHPQIPYAIALSTSPANRQYSDEERIKSWRDALT